MSNKHYKKHQMEELSKIKANKSSIVLGVILHF